MLLLQQILRAAAAALGPLLAIGSLEAAVRHSDDLDLGSSPIDFYPANLLGISRPIQALAADPGGRLAVVVDGAILLYDGAVWTRYQLPPTSSIAAVETAVFGTDGALFIGGSGGVERLRFRGAGTLERSWAFPPEFRNSRADSRIVQSLRVGDALYFRTRTQALALSRSGDAFAWPAVDRALTLFAFQSKAYLSAGALGALKLDPLDFTPNPDLRNLTTEGPISAAVSIGADTLLLHTQNGIYRYANGLLTPSSSELEPVSEFEPVGNQAAVVDRANGPVFIDQSGRIQYSDYSSFPQRISRATKLVGSPDGSLWAAIDGDLVRIAASSPIRYYAKHLIANPNSLSSSMTDDQLWLAAGGALLNVVNLDGTSPPALRKGAFDQAGAVHSIIAVEEGLITFRNETIELRTDDGRSVEVVRIGATVARRSRSHPHLIAYASESAVGFLQREADRWKPLGPAIALLGTPLAIVEDAGGSLWIGYREGKVARIALDPEGPRIETYTPSHGLGSGPARVWKIDDQVYFSNDRGIQTFDASAQRFAPASALPERFPSETSGVLAVATHPNGDVWVAARTGHFILTKSGSPDYATLSALNRYDIESFAFEPSGAAWLAAGDRLARFDPSRAIEPRPSVQTRIELIRTPDRKFSYQPTRADGQLALPSGHRHIELTVSTPYLGDRQGWSHEYRASPGGEWTPFPASQTALLALPFGSTAIEARAVTPRSEISRTEPLAIRASRAWTRPALFLLISLAAGAAIAGLLRAGPERRRRQHAANEMERLRTEVAKLREAASESDSANRAKSRFLASMSHEIRTPLNGVIGMTSLLKLTDLGSDQREIVQVIESSGENVVNIINDILDYSKIEAGRVELESLVFSLRECVEQALDIFIEQVSRKELELVYLFEDTVPETVRGDPSRLRQILVNLVGNAVKFTPSGHIYVSVSQRSRVGSTATLHFTVTDTGIGFPADKKGLLFKTFSQIDDNKDHAYSGTGLGLAISKKLVELMGGEIDAESVEGKGSVFSFTVQLEVESDAERGDLGSLEGKRVLIVEDSDIQRKLLVRCVRNWKANTSDAASPSQAIELIDKDPDPFDVAIIDLALPEKDGNQLAEEIRSRPHCRNVKLLSITASSVHKASELFGATLTKPIKPRYLLKAIRSCLDSRPALEPDRSSPPDDDYAALGHDSPLSILLVDDNETNLQVARMLLSKLGYVPTEAANGQEAAALAEREDYDVILMDVQMPVLDGRDATRLIRKLPKPHRPWIIAVTAGAMRDDMERAIQAGMDDYISKPILLTTLQAALERARDGLAMRSRQS